MRRVRPAASGPWGVRPVCRNVTPSKLSGRVLRVTVWLPIHVSYRTASPLGEGQDIACSLCVHSLTPGPGACSGLRDCPVTCRGWGVTSRQQWRWWDWRDGPRLPLGENPCPVLPGALSSPEFFSYGVEAYEACKKRSLTSDIIAEQKKVQEADLVMFQVWFPSDYGNEFGLSCVQSLSRY